METHTPAPLLSTRDLAKRLAVAPKTIHRLVERGQLRPIRLSPLGPWRFDEDEVRRLLAESREAS